MIQINRFRYAEVRAVYFTSSFANHNLHLYIVFLSTEQKVLLPFLIILTLVSRVISFVTPIILYGISMCLVYTVVYIQQSWISIVALVDYSLFLLQSYYHYARLCLRNREFITFMNLVDMT